MSMQLSSCKSTMKDGCNGSVILHLVTDSHAKNHIKSVSKPEEEEQSDDGGGDGSSEDSGNSNDGGN
ncbi:MAG: hypothetical protein WA461_09180 [Nitrososphaeraceae archaeon]